MALRDYAAWHDEYDRPGSPLHLRLLVVQDLIACALDELPPGPIRAISMCAGRGRDLIGVARRHRRGRDLAGILAEADPRNAAAAAQAIGQAGLDRLAVIEGDAGQSGVYAAAVPADLIVACGIFGNVSDEDIRRTVRFLPTLCGPGAWVIWTRRPQPDGIVPAIRGWFEEAGFRSRALVVPDRDLFGVGAARLTAPPGPFRPGQPLFAFVR